MRFKFDSLKGATMVEYALLVALIAVVCIVGVRATGAKVNCRFNNIATALTSSSIPAIYSSACSASSGGGSSGSF